MVFTFANTLSSAGGAAVTSGSGSVSSSNIGSDAHEYIVNLTGVTNAQRLQVTLSDVQDSAGNLSSGVASGFNVLVGDVSNNGTVSAAHVGQVKSQSGGTANGTNFRSDVTADGSINVSDVGLVKSSYGTSLP